jgi:hypothetical protein
MIFTPHMLTGVVIGAKTQNLGRIIILGIGFHFVLDKLPHWDYVVQKHTEQFRKTKKIKALFPLFFKIFLDIVIGFSIFLIIAYYNKELLAHLPFIFAGIFFSVLPDIYLGWLFMFAPKKLAEKHILFHEKYLHYPESKEKEGKITFLGIATQVLVIIACVFLLSL